MHGIWINGTSDIANSNEGMNVEIKSPKPAPEIVLQMATATIDVIYNKLDKLNYVVYLRRIKNLSATRSNPTTK